MIPLLVSIHSDLGVLAQIHGQAFAEPWNAQALHDLLETPGSFAFHLEGGFIMVRAAAGEAEILTLAVGPSRRRQGVASALVRAAAEHAGQLGAGRLFLEVAVGNAAARALYTGLGFSEAGRRKGYYVLGQGKFDDALILRSNLPLSPLGDLPISG